MSSYVFLILAVQACLIQTAFSQYFGLGRFSPRFERFDYEGMNLIRPRLPTGPVGAYGGSGVGDVGVTGNLPVAGTALVAGQVPIMGSVDFGGNVRASGTVTIAGSCGCGGVGSYKSSRFLY